MFVLYRIFMVSRVGIGCLLEYFSKLPQDGCLKCCQDYALLKDNSVLINTVPIIKFLNLYFKRNQKYDVWYNYKSLWY